MEYIFSPSPETVSWLMIYEEYVRIIIISLGFLSGTVLAFIFSSKWT